MTVDDHDSEQDRYDVIIVGGGNAGFSAAHAALERGASVLLLEKAEADAFGGNSFYTAGAFRVVHEGLSGARVPLDDDERLASTVLDPYSAEEYLDDLVRVTEGRTDREMADYVIRQSASIVEWLASKGIVWRLMYERQAYPTDDGTWVFWGGLAFGTVDGGRGLMEQHRAAALRGGVEIVYGTAVTDLVWDGARAGGVVAVRSDGTTVRYLSGAVVLAAGGFEANADLRADHLGSEWATSYVRGTPSNTGEVLELAIRAGAARHGDWASCHAVAWDGADAPGGGDRVLTNQRTRQSYPLGIVVNLLGERFIDEGADFRNYTYAKYGAEILKQPGGRSFQLFDAKTRPLLRAEEYESPGATVIAAESIGELADRCGIDRAGLEATIERFNAGVSRSQAFDPTVKDGRRSDTEPPKSNWALELDTPPYYAYEVGCGITFTFGGLHVTSDAEVLDEDGAPIPGLYAAGELVGGLFSGNYPGGSGLTQGTVYGRSAGANAAALAKAGSTAGQSANAN